MSAVERFGGGGGGGGWYIVLEKMVEMLQITTIMTDSEVTGGQRAHLGSEGFDDSVRVRVEDSCDGEHRVWYLNTLTSPKWLLENESRDC